MALTKIRMCTDGQIRYVIGVEGGTVYLERYIGASASLLPFLDGSTRKAVMTSDEADIDYYQNYLVVDDPNVGTYMSPDLGENWLSV